MNKEALDFWKRAVQTYSTAKELLNIEFNSAASRAYYAAFYSVSALFASEGKTFKKHSGIISAVHHDLVYTGRFPVDFGKDYASLEKIRNIGDYGGGIQVTEEDAKMAVKQAHHIIKQVSEKYPAIFLFE